MLCLGLQVALKALRHGKEPLVSWLPVLKRKKVANWNEWHEGRIPEQEIAIFEREAVQQGVFDGP